MPDLSKKLQVHLLPVYREGISATQNKTGGSGFWAIPVSP